MTFFIVILLGLCFSVFLLLFSMIVDNDTIWHIAVLLSIIFTFLMVVIIFTSMIYIIGIVILMTMGVM